jgi:hypothetical protein
MTAAMRSDERRRKTMILMVHKVYVGEALAIAAIPASID